MVKKGVLMTATESLRQLLDDRGVEYETYHDAALTEVDAVFWQDRNGQPCSAIGNADDIPDGMLSVQCIISPEQAAEATLGRGTCKDVAETPKFSDKTRFECSACGYEYSAVGGFGCDYGDEPDFDYCPNCGREVVE